MKWLWYSWIQPLQNRVKGELPPEGSSFLMAWSVVTPILIFYLVNTLCVGVFGNFMRRIIGGQGTWLEVAEWLERNESAVAGIISGLAMLAGAGTVWHLFRKEAPQIGLPIGYKKHAFLLVLLGATTALCFNVLLSLLQITASSESYTQVAEKQFALPLWEGILLYGLISPLAEEIVFRGLVYNRLRRQYGLTIAVIGSAVLFGVYHGNEIQALYGFVMGVFMAVLYERYGSFLVPLLLHSAANSCIYVIVSNTAWQHAILKKEICVISGVISAFLLWIIFSKKMKQVEVTE